MSLVFLRAHAEDLIAQCCQDETNALIVIMVINQLHTLTQNMGAQYGDLILQFRGCRDSERPGWLFHRLNVAAGIAGPAGLQSQQRSIVGTTRRDIPEHSAVVPPSEGAERMH